MSPVAPAAGPTPCPACRFPDPRLKETLLGWEPVARLREEAEDRKSVV